MTPSEINVAIAGWMGWTDISPTFHVGFDPDTGQPRPIPNYHGDLNTCWDAEEHLETAIGSVHDYLSNLKLAVLRDCQGPFAEAAMVHATAPERSEALLRALNLWKE